MQASERTAQLRLWPGVVIVALQWLVRFVVPVVVPGAGTVGAIGALLGGVAFVVWWAFFSRAPLSERWGAVGLMIVALVATPRFAHESMATAGMGVLIFVYILPVLSLAFVVWAVTSRHLPDLPRRAAMVATILLACGVWTLVQTGGITGDGDSSFAWRWAETPEERLLAQVGDEPTALPSAPAAADTGAGWPGFRGPDRDSVIRGVRIETDWSASPPGPGASGTSGSLTGRRQRHSSSTTIGRSSCPSAVQNRRTFRTCSPTPSSFSPTVHSARFTEDSWLRSKPFGHRSTPRSGG